MLQLLADVFTWFSPAWELQCTRYVGQLSILEYTPTPPYLNLGKVMVDTMCICMLCDSAYVAIKASERSGWWGNCCDLCIQMENLRHLEMQVQIHKEELNSEVPSQFSLSQQNKQTNNKLANKQKPLMLPHASGEWTKIYIHYLSF